MKTIFAVTVITLTVCLSSQLLAEDWKLSSDANLTVTQNAYSNNWVGGEVGSLTWVFNSNSLAEKQVTPKFHNKNTLKLAFGQTRNQDRETKEWASPVKSTDLIDFESISRLTFEWFVDPFGAVRLQGQFLDSSNLENERYLNPLDITETLGVARSIIKEENREWTARLGAGFRQHINRDVLVDSQKETQTSNDGGFEFVTDFKTPLAGERISLTSKLIVFQAVFNSESDELEGLPNEDYWKYPDVDWENIFTVNITKYLMVNLYIKLLYDKEIDTDVRFKQTLSLGVTYKLL